MEAFGLAANIVSLIHITTEVIKRLNDFKTTATGVPRSLQNLTYELPALNQVLRNIHEAIECGSVPQDSIEALEPLLTDFSEQIKAITDIVEKVRPKDPSRLARNLKAFKSFQYDEEIKDRTSVIRGYTTTLTLERIVSGPGKDLPGRKALHHHFSDVLAKRP